MLEEPSISIEKIIASLQTHFRLKVESLTFLPLGADVNTAVYRLVASDDRRYFVRLRFGLINKTSLTVPKWLHDQGISHVIPPVVSADGELWAPLGVHKVILYPYVDGHDGYEVDLSDSQWVELGQTMRRIHDTRLPAEYQEESRQETWSPVFRESLRTILGGPGSQPPLDPLGMELISYLDEMRASILDLIGQASRLVEGFSRRSPDHCLCHGDLHAGNLLFHARGGFYLVDWDDLLLAPREKDLMSIGGGLFGGWRLPAEEEALFYRGYGPVDLDRAAIAYYRCERIITDLVVECRQILDTGGNMDDRRQAFTWMRSNFLPTGALSIAQRAAAEN